MEEKDLDFSLFCGICIEKPENFNDCVEFESFMEFNGQENLTYLECFELVTHIKFNADLSKLCLCTDCRIQLENSFLFLKKAERSQRFLNEKIELELSELQLNSELNDLTEETVVEDEFSTAPVLKDKILSVKSSNSIELDDFKEDNYVISYSDDCIDDKAATVLKDQLVLIDSNVNHMKLPSEISEDDTIENSNYDKTVSDQEELEYSCHICAKKYRTEALLNTHLRYHKRKKTMESDLCKICGKQFSSKSYLRQHMELVHASKRQQLKCDECEKIYFSKASLQVHKRLHTGKTVTCLECNKHFLTKHDLNVHLRFHTKKYPFQCKLCDKNFPIKSHLNSHIWREHEGLKLQCNIEGCNKLFTSHKALLEHSFVHADKKPYPCSYCSKSYPSKQKYKVHLFMVHKLEFDEVEDIKSFQNLKIHPRSRKFNLVQVDNEANESNPWINIVEVE